LTKLRYAYGGSKFSHPGKEVNHGSEKDVEEDDQAHDEEDRPEAQVSAAPRQSYRSSAAEPQPIMAGALLFLLAIWI